MKIKISIYHLVLLIVFFSPVTGQGSIVDTKHNLSVYGPGDLKASLEDEICIFCHASHNTETLAPLWNRYENNTVFTLYGSPTMSTSTMQPGSKSRLCLSCHDGTVALGLVRNRPTAIEFPQGMNTIPADNRSNLTDNLADDHPLTLDFSQHPSGELSCTGCHDLHAGTSNNLECTSCHDPHHDTYGKFLITDPINGTLCYECHQKSGWDTSPHKNSSAGWNQNPPDPWTHTEWNTVSENACNNCHNTHGAGSNYWIMNFPLEEENCYVCHNGNVASTDVESVMFNISKHPVDSYQNIHSPDEELQSMTRHVECSDCHNPHYSSTDGATAPSVPGSLTGVSGIDINGTTVSPAQNEYEVCFKCHEYQEPSTQIYVYRVDEQTSIRQEFSTSNASFHPVVAQGNNPNVPSLISPLTPSSMIYCTDCHNSDTAENIDGVNGPHASSYSPILKKRMVFNDYNNESESIYALCYSCHDRSSILNDESGFSHWRHIRMRKTSCTTCHDPHGSYNNTHLINFNSDYVTPSSSGLLMWVDDGQYQGRCYLRCHNRNHNPKAY